MSYSSPFDTFVFEGFEFDRTSGLLTFRYSFDGKRAFSEHTRFDVPSDFNEEAFERAAFLAFVLAGVSYYKCYPTRKMTFATHRISPVQAEFFNTVYRDGLSQFVYENGLSPDDIGTFEASIETPPVAIEYDGTGILALQSGGKDSLLLACMLEQKGRQFTPWYLSQAASHPQILDTIGGELLTPKRELDKDALAAAISDGALNGHVPVTFINLAYALVDAVLHGQDMVLAAIGQEGEEPHAYIGDYPVRHQWSKTWQAEQLFAGYVHDFVSPVLRVGSPLRGFSELKIAELFVEYAWDRYGHTFSSCNVANYKQGQGNDRLVWCGHCPKCANSFLLLAPFVTEAELTGIFGKNLFGESDLTDTFKGLLGVDNVMKPFECVGETEELRRGYWLARGNGYSPLPFDVPKSDFDRDVLGPHQSWTDQMIQ